jgi:hypothetical protein
MCARYCLYVTSLDHKMHMHLITCVNELGMHLFNIHKSSASSIYLDSSMVLNYFNIFIYIKKAVWLKPRVNNDNKQL